MRQIFVLLAFLEVQFFCIEKNKWERVYIVGSIYIYYTKQKKTGTNTNYSTELPLFLGNCRIIDTYGTVRTYKEYDDMMLLVRTQNVTGMEMEEEKMEEKETPG